MSLSSEIIPVHKLFAFVCVFMQGAKLLNSLTVYVFSLCFHAGTEAS